ncbi:glycoside hydrolase family 53 protein [Flavisolibacter tropicus]|uniref:Arabinogalactan endo-beta-1,4-galactanase n=1 Tax=Flavisolibacter tropicus TaxID=1492898 RepID=A0A172TYL8_9BACT|nr:glycosyl hydrolase 53 family protein [Flavisolibacter tropicus]ANE52082.1 arabinogalactan endo-1,4-beta-galactosidase [Flavisolibacter tropicus]
MKQALCKPLILIFFFACLVGCRKPGAEQTDDTSDPVTPPVQTVFAKGADVSWITEMEAANKKFYNANGQQQEGMALLKSLGMNTVRIRVWVNPTTGWNNRADVMDKAVRAKNLGLRIMIDFHYSDTWADPGNQTKPAAWASQGLAALKTSLYNHTTEVLTELKSNNIIPEWVQVGNETNDGMLWPEGKVSVNMAAFAQLVSAGYEAVKAVSSTTQVIVHLSNGYDNALYRWLFDGLRSNGAKWDVIGISLYPSPSNWSALTAQCLANMNDLVARYGKPVMVVEVGMSWDSPAESKAFLTDIISKTKSVAESKGLGVLYWEPLAYGNWQGYSLGAFDNSGKPTAALDAFR